MITIDSTTKQLLADPTDNYAKRRAWVIYQFRLQGKSLASVARDAGVARQTLRMALQRTYPRMEKVIADALGLKPSVIFPDRYTADGLPVYRMGRPKKVQSQVTKHNGTASGANSNVNPSGND